MNTTKTVAREVEIAGRHLRCQLCDHARFHEHETRMNTAVAGFFGFDRANAKATCKVCERCGFVHWFMPTHEMHADPGMTDIATELEALRQSLDDLYDQPVEPEREHALTH